jgi:hypothetical protein
MVSLRNRLDPLAANDVEQHQSRAGWAFLAAFQFGDVVNREVEKAREYRLAHKPIRLPIVPHQPECRTACLAAKSQRPKWAPVRLTGHRSRRLRSGQGDRVRSPTACAGGQAIMVKFCRMVCVLLDTHVDNFDASGPRGLHNAIRFANMALKEC